MAGIGVPIDSDWWRRDEHVRSHHSSSCKFLDIISYYQATVTVWLLIPRHILLWVRAMTSFPRGQVCPTVYLLHARPVCLVPEEWLLGRKELVTLTLSLSNSSAVVNQKTGSVFCFFEWKYATGVWLSKSIYDEWFFLSIMSLYNIHNAILPQSLGWQIISAFVLSLFSYYAFWSWRLFNHIALLASNSHMQVYASVFLLPQSFFFNF